MATPPDHLDRLENVKAGLGQIIVELALLQREALELRSQFTAPRNIGTGALRQFYGPALVTAAGMDRATRLLGDVVHGMSREFDAAYEAWSGE